MTISTTFNENTCIISPDGRIDTLTSPALEAAVKENADRCDKLILDMAGVDYISSAGLRVIVSAHKTMAPKGGLTLRGLNQNVSNIIGLTGFDKVLHIEE